MLEWLAAFGLVIGAVLVAALVLALFLLWLGFRRFRAIRVPPGADFFATLRYVPFTLVLALDLLDFALDIFALPVVWVLLSRYNLERLRDVAAIEALIPFTQPIPLLTLSWLAARLFRWGKLPEVTR